jgi:hypothetical protein
MCVMVLTSKAPWGFGGWQALQLKLHGCTRLRPLLRNVLLFCVKGCCLLVRWCTCWLLR